MNAIRHAFQMIQSEVILYFLSFLLGLCDYQEAVCNSDENPTMNCASQTSQNYLV